MNIRKVFSIILSLLAVFSLVACGAKSDAPVVQESTTNLYNDTTEAYAETVANTDYTISTTEISVEETSQAITTESSGVITDTETTISTTKPVVTTTEAYDNPADWSKKKIVEEYKKAAKKSNSKVKSTQSIALKDMNINDGEYDNVMSFVKTIIAKFLESNSTEKDGITGGFENLVSADVSSAKAYKSGNDTIIEMQLVEQTSGPKEDALSGSVGHGITAVGDISVVVKDLSDRGLPLELSEEDTKIYYTNPSIKVVINENGEIVSGTWFYTVEISMNNFKAFGQNVNKASIIMDNTITV